MAEPREMADLEPSRNDHFATTRWSIVLAAGRRSSPDADLALESLCEAYWYPLYAYARRRAGDVQEAQDLTQAFFAELLAKNFVGPATPARGRFRAYLLTAFKHFMSNEWQKAKAQKRGGGRRPLSLDFAAGDSRFRLERASRLTAEALYERQWALALLERVMDRLRDELCQAGKAAQFELLKPFLIGESRESSYAEVALQLGMSEAAAKMAASRLRRRYRGLLRKEIAHTVSRPGLGVAIATFALIMYFVVQRRLVYLPKLRTELLRQYTRIDDAALDHVARMEDLESCDVSGTRVTGAGLKKLAALKHITLLRLNDLPLTDGDISVLTAMKSLKHVELNHTKIMAAGFQKLSAAGIERWNVSP